jgi:ubiquinone/menaquinone biosynthesis C-methylase UbiE
VTPARSPRDVLDELLPSGDPVVVDVGCGDGALVRHLARRGARAIGVEIGREPLERARAHAPAGGERYEHGGAQALPLEDMSTDVVVFANSLHHVPGELLDTALAEAARVLRPGGTLAVADIVSGRALKETTRRNVDLWAACIAGAIPRTTYVQTVEGAGFEVGPVRGNDYRFVSDRALDACSTYEVQSVSLVAVKR